MSKATPRKIIKTCNKCGHSEEKDECYPDRETCQKCGVRHGQITLANSKPIITRGRLVKFVPA